VRGGRGSVGAGAVARTPRVLCARGVRGQGQALLHTPPAFACKGGQVSESGAGAVAHAPHV
jgi:hypothetical protein